MAARVNRFFDRLGPAADADDLRAAAPGRRSRRRRLLRRRAPRAAATSPTARSGTCSATPPPRSRPGSSSKGLPLAVQLVGRAERGDRRSSRSPPSSSASSAGPSGARRTTARGQTPCADLVKESDPVGPLARRPRSRRRSSPCSSGRRPRRPASSRSPDPRTAPSRSRRRAVGSFASSAATYERSSDRGSGHQLVDEPVAERRLGVDQLRLEHAGAAPPPARARRARSRSPPPGRARRPEARSARRSPRRSRSAGRRRGRGSPAGDRMPVDRGDDRTRERVPVDEQPVDPGDHPALLAAPSVGASFRSTPPEKNPPLPVTTTASGGSARKPSISSAPSARRSGASAFAGGRWIRTTAIPSLRF